MLIISGFESSLVDAWYGVSTTRVARTGVGSSSEGGPCQSVCKVPSRCAACRKGPSGRWRWGSGPQLREFAVQPAAITHSAAISTCSKGQQWQSALSLLAEMKAGSVEASVITYNAAISTCGKG